MRYFTIHFKNNEQLLIDELVYNRLDESVTKAGGTKQFHFFDVNSETENVLYKLCINIQDIVFINETQQFIQKETK